MNKIPIEIIAEALNSQNLDSEMISRVMTDIAHMAKVVQNQENAQRQPPVKKQFVIIVSDPVGLIEPIDLVGWVVQIPEDESPHNALRNAIAAANNFNVSKKGRKYPVRSIPEMFEAVSPKFMKDCGVFVKTKLPVSILPTDNVLPSAS